MAETTHHHSGLTYSTFLAVGWLFTGLAVLLTAGRYFIRYRMSTLNLDDWLQGFSLLSLIIFTSLYSHWFPWSVVIQLAGAGEGPRPSNAYFLRFFHWEVGTEFLFWVVLFSVKFTFLVFYRNLFGVSRLFMKAWWTVFAFTCACFLACFLTPLWKCEVPSHLFVLKICASERASVIVNQYAESSVAFNIASDLAIMVLPVWMLRTLRIPKSKKIALGFLFCLGSFVILVDILRIAIGDGGGTIKMAALWDLLEPCVAVNVSALPTYAALFNSPRERGASSLKYDSNSASTGLKYNQFNKQARPGHELSEDLKALRSDAVQYPPASTKAAQSQEWDDAYARMERTSARVDRNV